MADDSAKWSDVLTLFDITRSEKPRHVLECGCGISSVGIAYALSLNHRDHGVTGRLTSLEEGKEYLETMVLPGFPDVLRPYTEFHLAPVTFSLYRAPGKDTIAGVHYADLPVQEVDLAYIDGPQYKGAHAFRHLAPGVDPSMLKQTPFDSDIIHALKNTKKPIRVVIDMRIDSVRKLRSLLDKPYSQRFDFFARKTMMTLSPRNVAAVECLSLNLDVQG